MSLDPQLGAVSTITSGALPVTNNANLSLPYASGGGGGGGGGPNLVVSSIVADSIFVDGRSGTPGNNVIDFLFDFPATGYGISTGHICAGQAVIKDSLGGNTNALVSLTADGGGNNLLADFGAGRLLVGAQGTGPNAVQKGTIAYDNTVNLMTLSPASVSSLTVSSINGVAPGGSLFQSTFTAVPCPGNSSTILMEVPAGQYGFNGLIQGGGATSMLSGNVNVVVDVGAGPVYYGQINQLVGSQPTGSFPCQMVINQGDSGLSTIKLIVAATGGTSGAFTGVVSKLY